MDSCNPAKICLQYRELKLLLQLWSLKDVIEKKSKKKKVEELQSLAAVEAHEKDINCVAISPNESLVCTTSQDRSAKVIFPHKINPFAP